MQTARLVVAPPEHGDEGGGQQKSAEERLDCAQGDFCAVGEVFGTCSMQVPGGGAEVVECRAQLGGRSREPGQGSARDDPQRFTAEAIVFGGFLEDVLAAV